MVFSSLIFIFRFLPIAFLIYYLTPRKFKNAIILLLSLIFYSFGEGKYFFIMIASVIVDYLVSNSIEKNRGNKKKCFYLLLMSISFNLGILFFFKYMNFFIRGINYAFNLSVSTFNIALPLGISFYTFQTMSYTIDVYRGRAKASKNIIDFGAFVCMFPQLIAGPIVRYTDISNELKEREINKNLIEEGIEDFILGLSAKVLIANNIGMLWNEICEIGFSEISTILSWIGVISFGIQIYFDFYGYSLMAMGLGKALGFNFPKNFNYPYISRSISEFWRRWHITLGNWFREYVYIPLGGNRVGKKKLFFNLFIVWTLTGFWHGAEYNFILWGLYFFILITIEKLFIGDFLKRNKIISHIYTIFFLILGWGLFSTSDFENLKELFKVMFNFRGGTDYLYYLENFGVVLILSIILSTPLISNYYKKIKGTFVNDIILIFLFLISVAYIVDGSYNPFLYFRF